MLDLESQNLAITVCSNIVATVMSKKTFQPYMTSLT